MRVLIVHAHPEPSSFNGALTRHVVEALRGAGHENVVSDLYGMGFDPVSDRRNFVGVKDPERFSQQTEESFASATDGYVPALEDRDGQGRLVHGSHPSVSALVARYAGDHPGLRPCWRDT